jgi:hypothetical protein
MMRGAVMRWKEIFSGVVLFSFLFTLPVTLFGEDENCSDDEITRGAITALHLLRKKEKQAFEIIAQREKEALAKLTKTEKKKDRPKKRKRRQRANRRSLEDDATHRATSLPTTAFTTYNHESVLDDARGDIRMHNAIITKFNISTSASEDLNLELEHDNILYQGASDVIVKTNDIINVTGKNNVIVVRHTITFMSELRFAEGAELIFVFDDKYPDAKVVFDLDEGDTAFTLEPSCYLGFQGMGTVCFNDNPVIEFAGTTDANQPVFDVTEFATLALETGSSSAEKTLTFKGKGNAYWRGGASLLVNEYQQVIFGNDGYATDNIDIRFDNSSLMAIEGTNARTTIQKTTATLLFDKASVLHIGPSGKLEMNVNGDSLARGVLSSFRVDNHSIVRMYDTGRLHFSDNVDSSNMVWDIKDAAFPVHGDGGIIKYVNPTGSNDVEGRLPTTASILQQNEELIGTTAIAASRVAHFLVNQDPTNLTYYTEFKGTDGNTYARSPSGVVFQIPTGDITHESVNGGVYYLHVQIIDSHSTDSMYITYDTNGTVLAAS